MLRKVPGAILAGITAGFILYPFFKAVAGRQREVRPSLWVLSTLSLLFFIFYPYS
jgi:AGZA family xanthine/uracil permease-like MFS transporter